MSRLRMVLLFGIAAVLLCGMASAGEFYVDAEAGNDSNTGTSPDDAWLTISHALSSVFGSQGNPATVHVAAGTYSASTNGEVFPLEMKSYVLLVGSGAHTTMLDAEGNAYHVILCSHIAGVSIEGMTIQGGDASGPGWEECGGGVYCYDCTLTFQHNTVTGNSATWGGGMHCQTSSLSISNNTIKDNSAVMGAGVSFFDSSATIQQCVLTQNHGTPGSEGYSWGGGVYCSSCVQVSIRACPIGHNSASFGAGLYWLKSSGMIDACAISNNTCQRTLDDYGWGGGVNCRLCPDVLIQGCIVSENSAISGAGVCFVESSGTIQDCAVTGNLGTPDSQGVCRGGGIYCNKSSPRIVNCTLSNNTARLGGGIHAYDSRACSITNCILWSNMHEISLAGESEVLASYCCIQGGYVGEANIWDDPLFVSGPLGDYYLSCEAAGQGENSPCIDAGSDTAEALGLDELTTRTDCGPDTGVVDMGYHYPLGSDEGPTVECSLNAAEFLPGDQLTGEYGIDNAGPDIAVDVYFAFVMPDGAILCISPTRIDFGIFPCMTDLFLEKGYSMEPETLIDLTVPGGLPAGGYLFAGALSEPGRFEVIGDLSLFPFTLRADAVARGLSAD